MTDSAGKNSLKWVKQEMTRFLDEQNRIFDYVSPEEDQPQTNGTSTKVAEVLKDTVRKVIRRRSDVKEPDEASTSVSPILRRTSPPERFEMRPHVSREMIPGPSPTNSHNPPYRVPYFPPEYHLDRVSQHQNRRIGQKLPVKVIRRPYNVLMKEPITEPLGTDSNFKNYRTEEPVRRSPRRSQGSHLQQFFASQQRENMKRVAEKEPREVKEEPLDNYEQEYELYKNTLNFPISSHQTQRTVRTGARPPVKVYARPSTSTVSIKEPKLEPFEAPNNTMIVSGRPDGTRNVLKNIPSVATTSSYKNYQMNLSKRRREKSVIQPIIASQQCEEVKEEPIEVKKEPSDAYEQEYNSNQQTTSIPQRSFPHPLFPTHRPMTIPMEVQTVVIPRFKREKRMSFYEPVVNQRCQRIALPYRVYLGAEEPMKDFPEDKIKNCRRTIQKKVRSFTERQLLSFGKRPATINRDGKITKEEDRNRSVVLIEEIDKLREENQLGDQIDENVQQFVEQKQAERSESVRQKRAMANNLILNLPRVYEYLSSEEFREAIKPPDDASSYQKIVRAPNALAKFPAYSDTLSRSNPVLFKNLVRIHRMQKEDEISGEMGCRKSYEKNII